MSAYYAILTSDGEVHEFDNIGDYIDALDHAGPEAVDCIEEEA